MQHFPVTNSFPPSDHLSIAAITWLFLNVIHWCFTHLATPKNEHIPAILGHLIPPVKTNIAREKWMNTAHLKMIYLLKMVISHGPVVKSQKVSSYCHVFSWNWGAQNHLVPFKQWNNWVDFGTVLDEYHQHSWCKLVSKQEMNGCK